MKVSLLDRPLYSKYAAILWQPSSCDRDCKDCYVKNSQAGSTEDWISQYTYMNSILDTKSLWCNQLTISADKGSRNFIADILKQRDKLLSTSIHLTVKSFKVWMEEIQLPLEGVNVLTFSKPITKEEELEKLARLTRPHYHLKIGLNVILKNRVHWLTKVQPFIREGLVDQVYVIFKKPVLEEKVPIGQTETFFKALWQLQEPLKEISKDIDLYLDHCISRQFQNVLLKRNDDCSAGIDRIHIWPNGSITGCPYDGDLQYGPGPSRPIEVCDVAQEARRYLSKYINDFKWMKDVFYYG